MPGHPSRLRLHRCWSIAVAATTLAGCAQLDTVVKDRIALTQSCEQVIATEFRPEWKVPADFLRSHLAASGLCKPGKDGGLKTCEPISMVELELDLFMKKYSINEKANLAQIGIASEAIVTSVHAARILLEEADGKLKEVLEGCEKKGSPAAVRRCVLPAAATQLRSAAIGINAHIGTITTESRLITERLSMMSEGARVEGSALVANTEASLLKLSALLQGDAQIWLEMGRTYPARYAARNLLDLAHKGLRPLDARLDKLDDKSYGMMSAGVFLYSANISKALGKSADSLQQGLAPAGIKMNDPMVQAVKQELRISACTRLRDSDNPSMLAELLDTAIVQKTACMKSSSEECQYAAAPLMEAAAAPTVAAATAWFPGEAQDPPPSAAGKGSFDADPAQPGSTATTAKAATAPGNVAPPAGWVSVPPEQLVSMTQAYQAHEWAARKRLLQDAAREFIAAQPAATKTQDSKAPLVHVTADERRVQQIADTAVAPLIDRAWRDGLAANGGSTVSVLQLPATSVSQMVVVQNVMQAVLTLNSINTITVTNENSFAPSFKPVITITQDTRQLDNFCTASAIPGSDCWGADGHYFVRPRQPFATGAWTDNGRAGAQPMAHALEDIGRATAAYAKNNGTAFRATVSGYASRKDAAPLCNRGAWNIPHTLPFVLTSRRAKGLELEYHNRMNRTLVVGGCRTGARGKDGNSLLAAARAAWAAHVIEKHADSALSIEGFAAHGSRDAFERVPGEDAASDRTVVIELRTLGAPPSARYSHTSTADMTQR